MTGTAVAALGLGLLLLTGCSYFRSSAGPPLEPVSADSAAARPPAAPGVRPAPPPAHPAGEKEEGRPPAPAPVPAPADTTAPAPASGSVLTVRMSPAEEAALLAALKTDMDRAAEALALVRSRSLTGPQAEQVVAAEKFLKDAEAARAVSDLRRARTLAEKARILAEELRSAVGR